MYIKQREKEIHAVFAWPPKLAGNKNGLKIFEKIVGIYLNRTKYLVLLPRRIFFESTSAGAKIKKSGTLLSGKENTK